MERELYETEYKQLIVTKTDFNWLQVSSAYYTWLLKIIPSSRSHHLRRVLLNKLFLKVLLISKENTCLGGPQVCNFIKKGLQHHCFSVMYGKFLWPPPMVFCRVSSFWKSFILKIMHRKIWWRCYIFNSTIQLYYSNDC